VKYQPSISRAAKVLGLDVRSLAAFRVALGGVVLADMAVRSSDLAAMYGAEGFAPASFARTLMRTGQWSLHALSDATAFQGFMLAATAASALALAVGYRTRLATIACWVLMASLHARLPGVLNAGDTLVRVMLFWSMFLPLGAAWSLDARRRGPPPHAQVFSAASVAFIVQLAIVYWVAGVAKWNEDWLGGNALANIFGFGLYGTPLGRALIDYPALTRWASRSVVWLELLGPFLLFSPWATARLRVLAVVVFIAFHVAIGATITLGLFPYIAVAAWLALLPSEFWEWFETRKRACEQKAALGIPPLAPPFKGRGLTGVCCWAALALVVYWNIGVATGAKLPAPVGRWASHAINATGLNQSWKVFGRAPKRDGWFVYQARLKNGQMVDLRTGAPSSAYVRPDFASREFPNHRWRKLHWLLQRRSGEKYCQPLADYFVRRWNAAHGPEEQVVQLDLYCYRQALKSGRPAEAYTRQLLARVTVGEQGGAFADAARELNL
jgi:hypothetical protein